MKHILRKVLIGACTLLFVPSICAKSNSTVRELVFANDTIWHYFKGDSEPESTWNTNTFDDSNWPEGRGGFGYGDGDDNTIIENAISVYMRCQFTISNLQNVQNMNLYMDYDDGFVAYLNGKEIARSSNMGTAKPQHDFEATSTHEAKLYLGAIPEKFYISAQDLLEGENVLAIQVHNDKRTSSDLSANAFLVVEHSGLRGDYNSLPDWLADPLDNGSDLPIVVITTPNGTDILDDPKITAHMGIIDNKKGERNFLGDPYNEYDGFVGVELRGQSSLRRWDKTSYGLETRDSLGENRNVKLFGYAKENDWVLNACHYDRTFIRMPLTYWLSRRMGRFASHTKHCEVVVNGEYRGLYIFMEKIKRDDDRIMVTEMDETHVSGADLTGGYIIEFSSSRWGIPDHFELHYPKEETAEPEQISYINKYMSDFATLMKTTNYNNPETGYTQWIDVPSFVDEMLIQEFSKSNDAYRYSSYFHKNRSEKLMAGPVWDFDQSYGNSVNVDGESTSGFLANHNQNSHLFWHVLYNDADFMRQFQLRWNELRKGYFANDSIMNYIDKFALKSTEAQARNFKKWPILGVFLWREPNALVGNVSYTNEVDYLKNWISNRLSWLDSYFYDPKASIQNNSLLTGAYNYPNPFTTATTIVFTLKHADNVSVELFDISGRKRTTLLNGQRNAGEHRVELFGDALEKGLYYYVITANNERILRKVVKQ